MVRITIRKLKKGSNAGRYGVQDDGVTRISFKFKRSAVRWAKARRKALK
jgi:hypothetical protein